MKSAREQGLAACSTCRTLYDGEVSKCLVCGGTVAFRRQKSIEHTWAFLIAGIAAYIPGNILPIMITATPQGANESTILGGVVTLAGHGSYAVALVIFFASVVVPVTKFAVIASVTLSIQKAASADEKRRHAAFETVELLGSWSMVDVFVVAALAALIQLGSLMSVKPGPGAEFFGMSVAFTMLAARSLDTRLIWDASNG